MKDYFGKEIVEGDIIVYGKSDRRSPLKVGTVVGAEEDTVKVIGDGNTRVGELRKYGLSDKNDRIVILPEYYKGFLGGN